MVIDNQPTIAALDVSEAVASWQGLGLSVLGVGKGVIAGIDRCSTIYADQLFAEGDLETGKYLESRDEIVAHCCSIGAHCRRQRSPEYGVIGIERENLVGIVFAKCPRPRR